MRLKHYALFCLLAISSTLLTTQARAALEPFQTFTGNVAVSTDGFGSLSNAGIISASVPTGSTVLAAYLYSATHRTSETPGVTLDGQAVSFGARVPNGTACCNLASFRADVTDIVSASIDAGPGGVYDFDVVETALGSNTDGEALVVIYENAALPTATVGILDGFASVNGDTASINFGDALDPTSPDFFAEMALGISFSCCNQKSTIDVNGNPLTINAGNFDDGNAAADGTLITVGSFDDPFSATNPTYSGDSERYNLGTFVMSGDTSIVVETANASQDDNIFLASFYVSGLAGINEEPPMEEPEPPVAAVPEPTSLALLGLGAIGLFGFRRKI